MIRLTADDLGMTQKEFLAALDRQREDARRQTVDRVERAKRDQEGLAPSSCGLEQPPSADFETPVRPVRWLDLPPSERMHKAEDLRSRMSDAQFFVDRASFLERESGDPLAYWAALLAAHMQLYGLPGSDPSAVAAQLLGHADLRKIT